MISNRTKRAAALVGDWILLGLKILGAPRVISNRTKAALAGDWILLGLLYAAFYTLLFIKKIKEVKNDLFPSGTRGRPFDKS